MKKQMIKLYSSFAIATLALIISLYYPVVTLFMILSTFLLYFLPPDMPEYDEIDIRES